MGKNKGKKKQQSESGQPTSPPQEGAPGPSVETRQPPEQPQKEKKGKQKQQSQGDQPTSPPQEAAPGSSRETSQPPEQPQREKKEPGPPSQGTLPVHSQEAPGQQGDQPKKGKRGKGRKQLDDGKDPQKEQPKGPQQGPRGPDSTGQQQGGQPQQQQGGQPQQQRQQGPSSQPQRQHQQGPPQRQQHQQGPPQRQQHQQGPQGPSWRQQQRGGPPEQAGVPPPHQAQQQPPQGYAGHPHDVQTPRQVPQGYQQQQFQQYPQQQFQQYPQQVPPGYPQQGFAQYPQQVRFQAPQGGRDQPPPPFAGQGAGRGQSPQKQQGPGYPSGQQQVFQPPPQQVSQPPPQQVSQPPPQEVSQPGQQQQPKQKGPGKGQPRQQQQQPARGQQPSRSSSQSSVPSVGSVTGKLSELEIGRGGDGGDANLVSKTNIKPGTKGRIIKVESNHLQLNLGSLKVAYHYDVNIEPDKPKKFMRPVVNSFIRTHFPRRWPAFDGKKNLYTASPLTNNLNDFFEDEVIIPEEDNREKKFKVEIKFANKVDLTPLHNLLSSPVTPQEALQVVDIVLRMAPVEHCYPVGRSFFVKPERIIDLGQGMEMYSGFYQSAIRGWKPLLNVDVAHKAFPKDINVVDALVELLNTGRQEFRREDLRNLDRYQEETLTKYIKTLRINYEIPGHPGSKKGYRVNGIGECAQNAKFMHENRQITIVEYFGRYKNYRIRYPQLPTLWVGRQDRPDKILLPMELCVICEGQGLNRKMTDLQTSKMIRHAATDTGTRKSKIMQGVGRANYNNNQCVKEFGFSVGSEFQKLDARVLNPPNLEYGNNRIVRVSRGVWRNDSFLSGVTINSWTFVNACRYPPRPDEYRRMVEMFERSARDCGMTFASRATEPFKNIPGRQTYSDIEQYFRSEKNKFDVIFVIVPESGPQYSYVKKAAEIAVGCLTQCIKSNTVGRKMNPQTAVNILLKVNSKLNGVNHTFSRDTKPSILKRPVMIMGADVTHPGPDARNIPSVAAVTASHDPKAFQYNISWRLQNPKVEIIEDLQAIVLEHLRFFYEKTRVKPEAIVFFRDGVSEGQFEQVKRDEIRAIRSACKIAQAEGYEPKITFIVVQKRHHTRLFPTNPRDSEDKNCNVPAGTCVDTTITHPFMQDFYLVSHASIQGVAKPTKYCTLWDDNNMDNDQVEELAYYLCHMFSRCNRSVSYPAPTYYAHLAAARAKVYIENDNLNMDALRQEFNKYQIKEEIRHGRPMFFV